jgi:hypothetical protein
MRYALFVFAVAVVALACAEDTKTTSESFPEGFAPPPPPEGGVQLLGKPFVVAPFQEVLQCVYLDDRLAENLDIEALSTYQMDGGHHVVFMWIIDSYQPATDVHECTDYEMVNQRFIGAGGSDSQVTVETPEGVAIRVPGKKRFAIQSHYINTTEDEITVMDAVNLIPAKGAVDTLAAMAAHVDDTFELPPGQLTVRDSTCNVTKEGHVFQMVGHTHELGKRFRHTLERKSGDTEVLYENKEIAPDFRSNAQTRVWPPEAPLLLSVGDKLHLHCEWDNTTPETVLFPKEMCVSAFYYYPARGFEICNVNGGTFESDADLE